MSTKTVFAPVGAHYAIADVSSAVSIQVPVRAHGVFIQALAQNVRLVFGGGVATAISGFQVKADAPPLLIVLRHGAEISIIEEAASAEVQWQAAEELTW